MTDETEPWVSRGRGSAPLIRPVLLYCARIQQQERRGRGARRVEDRRSGPARRTVDDLRARVSVCTVRVRVVEAPHR